MPKKNLVSWNILITGTIKWGKIGFARAFFYVMLEKNVISWTGLIDGYAFLKHYFFEGVVEKFHHYRHFPFLLYYGSKPIFYKSWTQPYNGDCVVGAILWSSINSSVILTSYIPIFSGMGSSIFSKQFDEALSLFRKMAVHEGIRPTEVTLLAIFPVPAIWNAGLLDFCQVFHAHIEKCGFNMSDVRVMNCLIDAYAKCGSIKSAVEVFEDITVSKRNLVSWTSIISGYAMHGMAVEASSCHKIMENGGLKPNRIIFLTVLNACSHGGLVDKGLDFYQKMADDCTIAPDAKLYGSLKDMLGRSGRLEEAERVAIGIPCEIVYVIIWRTLLGACSFMAMLTWGRWNPSVEATMFCQISFHGLVGMQILRVWSAMNEKNASKVPGFALV